MDLTNMLALGFWYYAIIITALVGLIIFYVMYRRKQQ
jgi:hypothetical protein